MPLFYLQLQLEQCFEAAQGLGDPNIEVRNEYNMHPSQANHAQRGPSIPIGYRVRFYSSSTN